MNGLEAAAAHPQLWKAYRLAKAAAKGIYPGWQPHRVMQAKYEPELRTFDRRKMTAAAIGVLALATFSLWCPLEVKAATMMLRGGNQTDLPPPPPGPPFVAQAIPVKTATLTYTAGGASAGVAEGGATAWTLTSTDFPTLNGNTYATLQAVYNALAPLDDFTVKMPAGNFQTGQSTQKASIFANYAGRSFAFIYDGAFNGFAPTTGPDAGTPNPWACVVKSNRVANQPFLFVDDPTHSSTITLQNFALSPWASDITTSRTVRAGGVGGTGLIFKLRCGILQTNQMQVARGTGSGITAGTQYEYESLENDIVLMFDTQIYGCGANADQHNVYMHCTLLFRCKNIFTHDSGGHAWKVQGGRAECLNSHICGARLGISTWGKVNPLVNTTHDTDTYIRDCVLEGDITSTIASFLFISVRREDASFINLKMPNYFYKDTRYGMSRVPKMYYGGDASEDSGAVTSAVVALGTRAVSLKNVGAKLLPTTGRQYTDTRANALDVLYYLDDNTLVQDTATVTTPITKAAGYKGAIQLTTPTTGTIALNRPFLLRYNAASIVGQQHWDFPVRTAAGNQQDLFDPSSPTYYWDQVAPVVGGVRVLDFSKQRLAGGRGIPMQYLDRCLFVLKSSTRSTTTAIGVYRDFLTSYLTNAGQIQSFAFGAMSATDGGWTVGSGAGNFDGALHAGAGTNPHQLMGENQTGGLGLNGTDWVRPSMLVCRNLGFNSVAVASSTNKFKNYFDTRTVDGSGGVYSQPVPVNVKYLNSSGALATVTDNALSGLAPLPVPKEFVTTGQALEHATSIAIQQLSGGAPTFGDKLLLALKDGKGVHQTTVISYVAGVLTWLDELLYDSVDGASGACFTPAGTQPAGWESPEDFSAA